MSEPVVYLISTRNPTERLMRIYLVGEPKCNGPEDHIARFFLSNEIFVYELALRIQLPEYVGRWAASKDRVQ